MTRGKKFKLGGINGLFVLPGVGRHLSGDYTP